MPANQPRTVLVVGALGGLATRTIVDLLDEGHRVIGVDRLDDPDGRWREEIDHGGTGRLEFAQLDATDEDAVDRFASALDERGTTVDALVNTAGMQYVSAVSDLETKYWRRVQSANLDTTFFLTRAFIQPMIERRWGRIVTFTSVYAYQPTFGQAAYAAAKAGVIGFTRSVAADAAPHGVTVNAIAPAVVWHDRLRGVLPEDHMDELRARIPQGEFGEPAHISATVRYLISEGGGHTTGQTIHVNGGMFPGG